MNLTEAIQKVIANQQVDEATVVGGGATGTSIVPDPVGGRATAPGASKTQGDLQPKKLDGEQEETDTENNSKPTGDMSAKNKASISAKGGTMKEQVESMFEGENLSEEFKEKMQAVFEAAVAEKAISIEEEFDAKLAEEVARLEEEASVQVKELVEKLDEYLAYAVEQWMLENEIAIESSLRSEITENFISNLKNLFAESYIEVPEDKYDVVEGLAARVQELEAQLNETVEENIELSKSIIELAKDDIIDEITEGLAVTQIEKLKKLAENIEFDSAEGFKKKVGIIKENYFPQDSAKKSTNLLEESFDGDVDQPAATGSMAKYVKAISKAVTK